MLCKKPFRNEAGQEYGCGQCQFCRINRLRTWVGRMQLEAMEHQHNCFVTLTFNNDHVPADGGLSKRPLQLFLKRLRHEVGQFRYYAVGEYGDQSWRPHYHLILFGVSPMQERLVAKCWPCGFVQVGTAEAASMSYVCSYVLKKLTNPKDRRLNGKPPEFATMSRRPGIGFGVVKRIKRAYEQRPVEVRTETEGVLNNRIRIAGSKYPLGRYLREKALDACGFSEDEREDYKIRTMCAVYEQETLRPQERAAKVQAQEGKYSIRKGRML
ncbi:MAG: replication initiator protein [Microviridae sp.]|nr:MAG: replication initiator protein [Microviridae sp.]